LKAAGASFSDLLGVWLLAWPPQELLTSVLSPSHHTTTATRWFFPGPEGDASDASSRVVSFGRATWLKKHPSHKYSCEGEEIFISEGAALATTADLAKIFRQPGNQD
jgi:hypothetical protein